MISVIYTFYAQNAGRSAFKKRKKEKTGNFKQQLKY